ncbi:Polyadenylate-binding protein [Carex littledalei]|uniref:Polyadenylate-binding protein n=1 Tax=Carex littledalei TaxID=544730 RepID=A0A833RG76_9POAL|nr:Polyadenylate-binding protein [Carex littledalei]
MMIEHHGEIVESSQLETVGENGGEATGDIPNLALGRVNDTESISDEKEGKAKQLEEVGDDEEEEYYLIEEIVEEGEEEADIGESECVPTGEDLKEDEEHRQVVKKQCKRKEYEVFVGGLHRFASKDDIHEVFSQVGEVKSIRMAMDRWSNKNRGYAFVRYRTVEQARHALTELKNPLVHGKRCVVTASRENDTLFVGNICKTWSQELFKDKLKSYGVVNYKEVVLIQDNRYRGANKGFAFLEFWSLAQATWAYVRLHKSNVVFGTDHAAKVSFAVFDKSEREITFQAKTVFLNGVPPTWDEDWIRSCLQRYGFIESVKLARDMNTAKRPDFGYVTFDTHNSARRCIQGINAGGLGKGHHKVRAEAQFCRPRNPRSNWNVKGIRDVCSKAKSTHYLHFSPSPQKLDRAPAHIPKGIAEIRVLPTRDCGLKRPLGLSDRNQVSVSKKPRRMVSFHRSPRRMLQDQDCCVKRNAREHIDAEYNSHVIVERRHSTSCEHVYSDRHSHAYNEYFRRDPHDLQHDIDGCYCEFPKRMDCSPDINEDLSIRRSKLWFDYDARSSRCAPCDMSSSRNRRELSNVASGTGSSIYFRDKMYRGSDDLSYYRGSDGAGDFHGAYISSSSRDSKYYTQRSDGGGNSYLSFHEHNSCCNSTSRG